jgi:hypothetical protein
MTHSLYLSPLLGVGMERSNIGREYAIYEVTVKMEENL